VSVLLDTGIVYAYYDRSDRWHARARTLLRAESGGLILPAPVIPEIDHLLGARLGDASRRTFYAGIVGAHFFVTDLPRAAYARVAEIDLQFQDLSLGFADAAIVALAASLNVRRVATVDRRHFTPLAAQFGLELLP
jgi:predicted nucleic acid-binding protein